MTRLKSGFDVRTWMLPPRSRARRRVAINAARPADSSTPTRSRSIVRFNLPDLTTRASCRRALLPPASSRSPTSATAASALARSRILTSNAMIQRPNEDQVQVAQDLQQIVGCHTVYRLIISCLTVYCKTVTRSIVNRALVPIFGTEPFLYKLPPSTRLTFQWTYCRQVLTRGGATRVARVTRAFTAGGENERSRVRKLARLCRRSAPSR